MALKVPNAAVLDNPRRIERFLREAKAAANLRHPHIVPVFDAGKDADRYFIASAFISGQKLADAIPDGGIEFDRAARLARELAEALAYAHEQGVVHRDVKPDNVMLDAGDRVHLMDFGLAARQDDESRLTNDGAVLGTPSYMAPEQARGQQGEARPAADQYSAGVVLYELLTGRVPFEGPPTVVLHNQIHIEPDRPTKFRPDTPKDLETICLKAISKRPEDRYADCQALADDLRRWQEGEPIEARRLGPAERLARWTRRNKATAGLALGVATSLLFGTIVSVVFAFRAYEEARRADRESEATREALGQAETNARLEEAERKRAEKERAAADEQRRLADQARDQAVAEQMKTAEEKTRADKALAQLRLEEEAARRSLYSARMQLGRTAWKDGRLTAAARALADVVPTEGKEDLRRFEWYYLKRLLSSDQSRMIPLPAVDPGDPKGAATRKFTLKHDGVAASPDGKWLIVTGYVVRYKQVGGGEFIQDGNDYTVVLLDVATGREVRCWPGVRKAAFSPDSRSVALLRQPSAGAKFDLGNVLLSDLPPTADPVDLGVSISENQRLVFAPDGRLAIGANLVDPKSRESVRLSSSAYANYGLFGLTTDGKKVVMTYPMSGVATQKPQISIDPPPAADTDFARHVASVQKFVDAGKDERDWTGRSLIARQDERDGTSTIRIWDVKRLGRRGHIDRLSETRPGGHTDRFAELRPICSLP